MTRPIGNFGLLQGRAGLVAQYSPNLRGALPRPLITTAVVAARAARDRVPIHNFQPPSVDQQARDQAAEAIATDRRCFWMAEHPGAVESSYFGDQDEYLALGRELTEAGLGLGLTSQWLAMCCAHCRVSLDGGAFRFLDTHQTVWREPSPGFEPHLVCVRCGATVPKLNREACRGNEIYRERVREDKARLGSVLDLYSLLGGS